METKTCSRCKEDKPVSEFSKNKKRGYHSICKECDREYKIFRRYNLEAGEFYKLYYRQQGKCAICGEHTDLHLDHCHSHQTIRGLLCGLCNKGLGCFSDQPERLEKAIKYLKGET